MHKRQVSTTIRHVMAQQAGTQPASKQDCSLGPPDTNKFQQRRLSWCRAVAAFLSTTAPVHLSRNDSVLPHHQQHKGGHDGEQELHEGRGAHPPKALAKL